MPEHAGPPGAAESPIYPRDVAYLASKVPPKEARVAGPVEAQVVIRWDTWDVAHIQAQHRRDLFFGLGYATAQECLWRLDYCRRLARGELAAVLGGDALASDRAMRLIGLGRHADEAAGRLPAQVGEALDALAAGINCWTARAASARTLPVEFDWLGYEPAPWTVADSIACWKHRWWSLTGRLEHIATGEAVRRHLPPELLPAFMSTELGEETIIPRPAATKRGARGAPASGRADILGGSDDGEGSNNWVVSGARTTTGYPVLCSDPHNPFGQPGQWFQAHLALADGSVDVAGAVYASSPGVYMGRNHHIAWGFTNHVASIRDLYQEVVDKADSGRYLENGQWRHFDVEHATIDVRGQPADRYELRRTVRGPVVNTLLPALDDTPTPVSLRWAGLEVGTGIEALLGLSTATSVEQALAAMEAWVCPIANLLLADEQGHIAYHVVGRVPRRREAARAYRRASDPAHAWQGFLSYDEVPQLIDPPRGWIATANQPPWEHDPPGVAYLGSAAWADGGRMRRIRQRLAAQERHSPEDLAAIQADITSVRAVELVPAVLAMLRTSGAVLAPAVQQALDVLRQWDGRYTLESAAPTVWTTFWDSWLRRVTAARFPRHLLALVQSQAGAVARKLLLGEDTSPAWFESRRVREEVVAALAEAISWLTGRFGSSPDGWRWGKLHTVTWRHPLAEHGPPAQRQAAAEVFNVGPFPTTGATGTVRAAGTSLSQPFEVTGGATYRLVADLSPGGALRATTTTGQSGHPGSPHYADQARLWLGDAYRVVSLHDPDTLPSQGVTTIEPAG